MRYHHQCPFTKPLIAWRATHQTSVKKKRNQEYFKKITLFFNNTLSLIQNIISSSKKLLALIFSHFADMISTISSLVMKEMLINYADGIRKTYRFRH